jgi:hypothetical protein
VAVLGTVAASTAVQVMVVVPIGKQVPEAGEQETEAPGQLSLTVGLAKVAVAQLPPVERVWFAGQPFGKVGGWLSTTVTVKEQDAVRPAASCTEQVTVVTPLAKLAPDAGEQVTGPRPGQLSVAVGLL